MAIALSAYATGWLDLCFRWFHVTAAIVWIGTSFYFVALDNHLRPAEERDDLTGESWEIHGGGFYRIEKFRVTPPTIPEPLHWYKWEAYTTWLSGFALLTVLPAMMFWNQTGWLMAFTALFIVSYVWAYTSIIRFKVPSWLRR